MTHETITDGLLTREQLRAEAAKLFGRPPHVRTLRRWEIEGLPVIRRGVLRLYDAETARAFIRGERLPKSRK